MARLKGKYKGKTGRIDIIEDIIGTEVLKGTYDERKHVAKLNKLDDMKKQAETQKQLDLIKKERAKVIKEQLLDRTAVMAIDNKIDFVLPFVLEFNAYYYLNRIRNEEPQVCKQIIKYLFPPSDVHKLDSYVEAIRTKGRGPKNKISYDTIDRIYRKVKELPERLGRKIA